MDFKPTLGKSIISLLVFIISDILFGASAKVQCTIMPGGYCVQPVWYEHVFNPMALVVSIIFGLILYVIWSLIQKK